MSDDKDQRTEDPTFKRLQDAESKGQIASSQEVKTWIIFVFSTGLLIFGAPYIAGNISDILAAYMEQVGDISSDTTGYTDIMVGLAWSILQVLLVVFVTFIIAAVIANRIQNNFLFTLEKLAPDLSKLNPISGIKKIFSTNNLVEVGKALVKLAFVGGVVFVVVYPERDRLDSLMFVPIIEVTGLILDLVTRMFIAVTVLLTIIAAVDHSWQTYQHRKNLRMTKQEVKDERKQSDGDPMIKRRLRSIRMERMAKRLVAVIPEADVIVTNPTHYAVALKYQHGVMDVPVVIAKGVDSLALRIRGLGEENGVPIVENPPLARTLHATVNIDDEIHPDQYQAVANVISYVMKLKKTGRMPKPKPRQDTASSSLGEDGGFQSGSVV